MCGLAGFNGSFERNQLADTINSIQHRGPDGYGMWHDPEARVGLAHARLAIIDLSSGAAQPMFSGDERYVTVFNGEIYNFRELNALLRSKGYALNLNSDTACLAPLFDLYRESMLDHLNGMFAFAIWDRKQRELFVARDHAGIKPLYYAQTGKGLIFASELKALIASGEISRDIDAAAILDYTTRLWSPGSKTPLRGVSKLRPGEYLSLKDGKISFHRWSVAGRVAIGEQPSGISYPEFLDLFDKTVADQCVSDAPIGAFLSGGVDSTSIVASMVHTGNPPVRSYCIGFDDIGMKDEGFDDDLAFAQLAARSLGVPLTPIVVPPPTAEDFERLVYMLDEPQADPAALYVDAISKIARADGVKVLLSGTGGDDLFTGYRRHQAAAIRSHFKRGPRALADMALGLAAGRRGALGRRATRLKMLLAGSDEEFVDHSFLFNEESRSLACLDAGLVSAAEASPNQGWIDAIADCRGEPLVERLLYMERFGFLPDHNLNYTDKAAMTHGIEVRVPFLDPRIINFAARIPWNSKISFFRSKYYLKQAVRDRIPDSIRLRSKTGFGGPVRSWVKGSLRDMIEDVIASRQFRERGLFDAAVVRQTLDDTVNGTDDFAYLLLEIVLIELWCRRFIDSR